MPALDEATLKSFYDKHTNFAGRSLTEYNISPGIKCKFDTIKERLGERSFNIALDVGCSGNSFIHFLPSIKHYVQCDLAHPPLVQYNQFERHHPTVGSITKLPYKDETFDLITALDVLEHIPDDQAAADELVRVLKKKGLLIVTVPHRKKYYTEQDRLCGHVRRYEYEEIKTLFTKRNLREVVTFPVYGQFMKIQIIQAASPEKTEQGLMNLRKKYESNSRFRAFWDIFVKIGSKLMKWDARFLPFKKTMDICIIFRK